MWIAPQACGLFSRPLTPALLVPRKPFLSVNGTIRALALFAGFRVLDTGYPHAVQMPVQVQLAPARHMNFSLTSLANRARPLCMENRSRGSWRQDIKIARVKSAACTSGHSGPGTGLVLEDAHMASSHHDEPAMPAVVVLLMVLGAFTKPLSIQVRLLILVSPHVLPQTLYSSHRYNMETI